MARKPRLFSKRVCIAWEVRCALKVVAEMQPSVCDFEKTGREKGGMSTILIHFPLTLIDFAQTLERSPYTFFQTLERSPYAF